MHCMGEDSSSVVVWSGKSIPNHRFQATRKSGAGFGALSDVGEGRFCGRLNQSLSVRFLDTATVRFWPKADFRRPTFRSAHMQTCRL